jgi:hypothetical protein
MTTPPGPDPVDHDNVVPLATRRPHRRRARAAGPSRNDPDGRISMTVHAGVPVVACEGRLGTDAARACSLVLTAAVKLRPRSIVVDLSRATVDEGSVPVLGLMRHIAARHGIALSLAGVPPRGIDVLQRAEVAALYDLHATLALAVGAAIAQSHRSLPRRTGGA